MQEPEFKSFVLNNQRTWHEGFADSIRIHADGRLSLWPERRLNLAGEIGLATGLSVDRNGNLFVIDAPKCRIKKYEKNDNEFVLTWSIGECGQFPGQFKFAGSLPGDLVGLGVAEPAYLGGIVASPSSIFIAESAYISLYVCPTAARHYSASFGEK